MQWLTDSCLVDFIDVTLTCEDANSKLVEIVTVADVYDEDGVGNSCCRFGSWGLAPLLIKQTVKSPSYVLKRTQYKEERHDQPGWTQKWKLRLPWQHTSIKGQISQPGSVFVFSSNHKWVHGTYFHMMFDMPLMREQSPAQLSTSKWKTNNAADHSGVTRHVTAKIT